MNIKRLSRPYRWVALILLSSAALHAVADCRAILEQGLRNTYLLTRSGDFKNSFSNSFCNSNLQKSTNSSGGNADIALDTPIGPIGFGGGYDEAQAKEFRNSACGGAHGSLSDAQYLNVLQKIADPNIVSAWSECEASAGGLLLNGELLDSTNLKVSLVFRNVGPIAHAVLTAPPAIVGAVCENMPWDKGTSINGAEQIVHCTRMGDSPIIFVVNTDYSAATFYIPQPKTIKLVAPVRNSQARAEQVPPPPPNPFNEENDDGYTVDSLICLYGAVTQDPGSSNKPRCTAACNARVGDSCTCTNPGFSGHVAKISIKGVLVPPGASPMGTPCK
jgi:hypothetical protein